MSAFPQLAAPAAAPTAISQQEPKSVTSYLANDVMDNTGIPHGVRAAMLEVFEEVFGEPMPALRARVAADEAGWQAMKEGGVGDAEIEEYLVRGHQSVKGLGWRVLVWIMLLVVAWQYSRTVAALIFVAPVVLLVIKTYVRVSSKKWR